MEIQNTSNLSQSVTTLSGVGPAYVTRLQRVGVRTLGDLLRYFPRRYDDLRAVRRLGEIGQTEFTSGQALTVRARIKDIKLRRLRGRKSLVEATLEDGPVRLKTVWWGQPYLAESLVPGREYIFVGKVRVGKYGTSLQSPAAERLSIIGEQTHTARLVPVYPETEGLSSRWLRYKIRPLLRLADDVPETLPDEIREGADLIPLGEAVRTMHFPESEADARRARYRFDFEHVFHRQLIAQRRRQRWREETRAHPISGDMAARDRFVSTLPWELTAGQGQALDEIITDMKQDRPMLRLLQGDVGSGKTAVAAAAAFQAVAAGFQAAIMAPTEVLARQHARTIAGWLEPLGVSVQLLVGSQSKDDQATVRGVLGTGKPLVAVGTHALIQTGVDWPNLALAVVDEQHRFGVAQRAKLRGGDRTPHLLSMTATPIPRTLAMVAYGDQDLSIIPERPAGRHPVTTRVIPHGKRKAAFDVVRKEIAAGRQAFVLYPAIAESALGLKAAEVEFERLAAKEFDGSKVALLHGRLPAEDKIETMDAFSSGELDVLVATSVVEVGVDVPNASVMLIEEAQRFGLAQLHQLRGRIGRGEHPSHCLLLPGEDSAVENDRLRAMERTDSGFELAEIDLELRGPGELLGTKQSGYEVSAAGLSDPKLLKAARDAAADLLARDPSLETLPALRERVLDVARLA